MTAQYVDEDVYAAPPTPTWVVTPREADVLAGIAEGLTHQQIARRLRIAETTVKSHTKALYRRLGAVNGAHAVHIAHQAGMFRQEVVHAGAERVRQALENQQQKENAE